MKMKKIKVPKYILKDELGNFEFQDVEILVSPESTITPESFNQKSDDYSISSKEIERMGKEASRRFFNDKYTKVQKGTHEITPKEFNGIRLFLNVNGSELADLLNLDRSSISRVISGKQTLQKDTMMLLMERMKSELESPGFTNALLLKIRETVNRKKVEDLQLPAEKVAEYFIRKFTELEEHVTNLKLQKLLYYAQGIGFGKYNCKLIKEPFYAWDHGPVVREVWQKYTSYSSNPIPSNKEIDLSILENDPRVEEVLVETINMFGKYSAWVLRDMTHGEAPWAETPRNEIITDKKFISYFSELLI